LEHLNASLGQALALLANIRLGSRGFPGINTVAYLEHWQMTGIKFKTLGPSVNVVKQFSSSLWQNKLECLLLTLFFVG